MGIRQVAVLLCDRTVITGVGVNESACVGIRVGKKHVDEDMLLHTECAQFFGSLDLQRVQLAAEAS